MTEVYNDTLLVIGIAPNVLNCFVIRLWSPSQMRLLKFGSHRRSSVSRWEVPQEPYLFQIPVKRLIQQRSWSRPHPESYALLRKASIRVTIWIVR
jgi:hypothetical protein